MNKYFNPRLLNAVIAGTGMKHPVRPHVILGEQSNGFIRGDLMDANAIKEFIDQKISDLVNNAPEALDTLKELADAIEENGVADLVTKGLLEAALDDKVDKSDMFEGDANGYEYVDLGLPSGTLWATMNVGAESETDIGNYYMYGMGDKTYDVSDTPYLGTESPLPLSKDTARVVWGGDWYLPSSDQYQELFSNTTFSIANDYKNSGVNGCLFTAPNGNSVFFPIVDTQGSNGNHRYLTTTADASLSHIYYPAMIFSYIRIVPNERKDYKANARPVINISSKYATKADLSNYVQKSSTAGLLKNDGTVDTNTYLTQHQDLSNYALASDLQALVARVEALEQASNS